MLMLGKMSVGVRSAAARPKIIMRSAMTTKVYGRRSASLTIPIMAASWCHSPRSEPGRAGQHKRWNDEPCRSRLIDGDKEHLSGQDQSHDRDGGGVAKKRLEKRTHRSAPRVLSERNHAMRPSPPIA